MPPARFRLPGAPPRPRTARDAALAALLLLVTLPALLLHGGCGQRERPLSLQGVRKYGVPEERPVETVRVEVGEAQRITVAPPQPARPPGPRPPPGGRAPGRPGRQAYGVVAVQDGGTIRGVCKIERAFQPDPVPLTKDQDKCSHTSHPSERVVFDPETMGLANCVVFLAAIAEGKEWPESMGGSETSASVLLDQVKCVYVPHVQVVRAGTQLDIKNSDPAEHNVHAYLNSRITSLFNMGSAANSLNEGSPDALLRRAGLVLLFCDIHPWMNGYVHVVAHPYHAVTDGQGRFELTDVPPGEYALVCWHEGMVETPRFSPDGTIGGYDYSPAIQIDQKVMVEPNGETTVEFVVPVR